MADEIRGALRSSRSLIRTSRTIAEVARSNARTVFDALLATPFVVILVTDVAERPLRAW